MKDKEQLSSLISGIYDAALEPAQRIDVLERIAQFTGGQSSGLLVKHSLTASESLYCYLGPEPESLHANAAGTAILDDADFLRAISGRLIASESAINTAVHDILLAADGGGDDAVGAKGIALPLTAHTGERYVAHVLPLTSGARREAGLAYNAVAALFVRKATLKVYSPSEVIGTMYKLTPTELRVLLAIVDVGGVPEVAAALGVAATTIKTHLGRLFAKTGVARQADLVKLVAGFSTPLAG